MKSAFVWPLASGRRRLLQQFLTESLLLALAGGALGLVVALWTRDAVAAQLSEWEFVIPLDLRLLAFALSLSTVTALIFGVVPALKATSPHIGRLLQPADITRDTRHTRQRLARTLIVGQIALSLSVLVGAGLLVRTLQNLRQVDIGVDRAGVMAITLRADEGTIAPSEFPAIRLELAERLKRVQGVGEIAFSAFGLFTGGARTAPVRVPGSPVNPSDDPDVRQNYVSADYFKTLGMTASKGRVFVTEDVARDADVTVINESMARHYFGDANPVGRMIYFPRLDERRRYIPFNDSLTSAHGYEVVGVVRDGKYDDLREPAQRMAFLPLADVSASRAGSNAGLMYVRVSSCVERFRRGAAASRDCGESKSQRPSNRYARRPHRRNAHRGADADASAEPLRCDRAAPHVCRPLWRDGVYRGSANQRDRPAGRRWRSPPRRNRHGLA